MKAECMVRRASDADMDAVLAFAAQIFADEQDIPKELNFIPADKQPQWWCMEQDGELVGTAAIYREGGQWHMGRIAVAQPARTAQGNLSAEMCAGRCFCTGCG